MTEGQPKESVGLLKAILKIKNLTLTDYRNSVSVVVLYLFEIYNSVADVYKHVTEGKKYNCHKHIEGDMNEGNLH